MPRNDPVQDLYQPPSNQSIDFEEVLFEDVEVSDLFWLQDVNNRGNAPYKKLNGREGINVRTNKVQSVSLRKIVYSRI
tara:strand:+ start:332 stop:565 length:234 start_codon:yes stop_codon:yes gene_type:complete